MCSMGDIIMVTLLLPFLFSTSNAQGMMWDKLELRKWRQTERSGKRAYNSLAEQQSTGPTEWTSWFNIDHPGGNGDYERLEAIRYYYRERVCARPVAMEARTSDWVAATDTGEVVHASLDKGFWCVNKEQPGGRTCSNYHVRFQCPPVNAYWTDWAAWGSCSATACDDVGIQVRKRKCVTTQPTPLLMLTPACQGHHIERRECSTPPCQVACQRVCPEGRPSEDCSRCVCEGHLLHGEVLSATGVPVPGARVALADHPQLVRARTNGEGLFKIPGACSGSKTLLLISKEKFAPVSITPTSNNSSKTSWVRVVLKSSEKPYIVKHPEEKVRYEGQNAVLCCKAAGSPKPEKYQWYHNGSLLDWKQYKYEEDLVLKDLRVKQSGQYYCKAVSQTGSIKSTTASLTVMAKGTPACKSTPEPHLVKLPFDCRQPETDSIFYNAGRCPNNKCAGALDYDMRCRDDSGYCCSVKTMETRRINCGRYSLPIKVVTECACQSCLEPKVLVRGRVVAVDDDEPLRFGHIVMGKERVGTTGFQGGFTLQVSPGTERMVVNFVDPTQKFIDTVKVFIFDKKGGSVYHDVKVMRKVEPVDIDAGETNTIYLGEMKGEDPIGQLVIPPNSFHKSSGEVYEGTVKASVTFIDPRNITTAAAAPGDLNFIGDEGDTLPLRTYGMFSVDFRDDANQEVLGAGAVQVLLDTEHVKMQEHIPAMKLWSLNPDTGIWEEESQFSYTKATAGGGGRSKREERTFLIGNMEIRERRLFNLDVPESRRCFVKVRAYMSDKFLPTEQLKGVVISLINLEPKAGFSSNPRAWGRFDSVITGQNGACLPAFCDAIVPDAYTAYITAIMGGEELDAAPSTPKMNPNIIGVSQPYLDKLDYQRSDHTDPALKKTALRINLAKPDPNNLDETNGPIYPFSSMIACENAPVEANHFRFFRVEKDKYEYNVVPFEENDLTTWTGDYLSWWPNPQEFRACYIKVKIHGATEVMVRSRNLGGTHQQTRGQLYGIRDIRSTRDTSAANTSAACLEFKCGGMLFDQAEVDRSLISVLPQANCRRTSTNGLLQEYLIKHPPVLQNNESHAFSMLAPVDPLGHNYGIYTVTDQNPRVAKEIAIGRCFDGTSDGFSREMKADAGVALTFSCPKRAVTRESLFQRLQTNPAQTLSQMARDMRESDGLQVRRGDSRVVAFPPGQQGRPQTRRSSNRRRAAVRTRPRK
ncbi:cartilage intermediate layer protein 1 isoform X2 [Engraulis encrasicolus]|uniref:cartilage intermediate layer protein 1 isoform X2 n=1 Tax=Engraulis encrasicolus TaxID=184585 RepID=UPI002FD4D03D